MGRFLNAVELKARTSSYAVKVLESKDLDDRYIVPAERSLVREMNLQLETDEVPPAVDARDVPTYLRATFDSYPAEEAKFEEDMKLALLLVIERMALNPNEFTSQSVAGASASFGPPVPRDCRSILRRWLPTGGRAVVR